MNLLTPQEFYRRYQGARSISIVGNSDSLLQWENGPRIDASDLVIRFNLARVKGFEKHVGTRTDLLVTNETHSSANSPSPAETLDPTAALLLYALDTPEYFAKDDLEQWLGDVPVFGTMAPDPVEIGAPARPRPFSSGTYALYIFTRMFRPEKIFLTGFNFFGLTSSGTGHYFSEKKPGMAWHDVNEEIRAFAGILSRFQGEVETTPEVAQALVLGGYRPRENHSWPAARPTGWKNLIARALFRASFSIRTRAISK
jgi:hypothetical protein